MTHASTTIARIDGTASHLRTPCGAGGMQWRTWGEGPAAVVLLHGGFGSWLHWIRNIEPLARSHRVVAADLPGLGDSDHPGEPVTPQRLGAIVAEGIAVAAGPRGPLHLVGFSFGGLVAGQAAALLGCRVASLTLVGASGLGLARPYVAMQRRHDAMTDDERLAALRFNLGALMLHRESSIDALAMEIHARNDARARLKSRRMSLGDSLRRALPACRGTIGGIWGEHDATVGEHLGLRRTLLAGLGAGERFRVVAGAGHWVQYEAAAAFDAALVELIATCDGARRPPRATRSP